MYVCAYLFLLHSETAGWHALWHTVIGFIIKWNQIEKMFGNKYNIIIQYHMFTYNCNIWNLIGIVLQIQIYVHISDSWAVLSWNCNLHYRYSNFNGYHSKWDTVYAFIVRFPATGDTTFANAVLQMQTATLKRFDLPRIALSHAFVFNWTFRLIRLAYIFRS